MEVCVSPLPQTLLRHSLTDTNTGRSSVHTPMLVHACLHGLALHMLFPLFATLFHSLQGALDVTLCQALG